MRRSIRRFSTVLSVIVAAPLFLAARSPDVPKTGAVSSHVVIISIDGLRPDAISKYGAHTLRRLRDEGAFSSHAQTVTPSKTLPSHVSMLTGVEPSVHGVLWNSDKVKEFGYVKSPTIFELSKNQGFSTAAFFSKTKFQHLQKPGTLDYTQVPTGGAHWMSTKTVADVQQYLKYQRPNLLFVHIGEPDFAGHTIGWMSAPYGWAVRRADGAVKAVLESADRAFGVGNYTVIITADHGGHGRDHGTDADTDMTIPWIVWGRGVERGEVARDVKTTDTAATVLWLLGVTRPDTWTGTAVASAFTSAARLAGAAAGSSSVALPQ